MRLCRRPGSSAIGARSRRAFGVAGLLLWTKRGAGTGDAHQGRCDLDGSFTGVGAGVPPRFSLNTTSRSGSKNSREPVRRSRLVVGLVLRPEEDPAEQR